MKIKIRVWGDYDRDNRTPLLFEGSADAISYAGARYIGESALKFYQGKSANVECDGPNQNYNSIWLARS